MNLTPLDTSYKWIKCFYSKYVCLWRLSLLLQCLKFLQKQNFSKQNTYPQMKFKMSQGGMMTNISCISDSQWDSLEAAPVSRIFHVFPEISVAYICTYVCICMHNFSCCFRKDSIVFSIVHLLLHSNAAHAGGLWSWLGTMSLQYSAYPRPMEGH